MTNISPELPNGQGLPQILLLIVQASGTVLYRINFDSASYEKCENVLFEESDITCLVILHFKKKSSEK